MRDSKGRFVHGHTPLNEQDKTTGRFLPNIKPEPQLIPTAPEEKTPPEIKPPEKKEETIIKNPKPMLLKKPSDWNY